ncbi:MAG TPA: LysR family transcriptional regulator [Polyangiaceae bacterium]|nr:LysR family transcriptional regulator [Polyangiaceae bacterium]
MSKPADFDWNDLRFALAAARAKTLAGASRALSVEHSTVGRRLAALEDALGTPLFVRSPAGLALTPAGEKALPLLEEMERAALALRDLASDGRARVRVAVPSVFGRLLAPHLTAFRASRPLLSVEILSGGRPVDLKRGEADVALRSGPIDDDLVAKRLCDITWSLYASASYLARRGAPADPRDLSGHDVIGAAADLKGVAAAEWLERHTKGANMVMHCREVSDLLAACVAGVGIALLPCLLADAEPALDRLTPEPLCSNQFWMVYRKESLRAEPVRAVVEFLSEMLRVHDKKPRG